MSTSVFNSPVFNQVPFNGGASASAPVTGACVSLAVALADCGEVMAEYTIGNLIRVSAAFTNSGGSAVDPGQVKAKLKSPLGVITTYTYGTDAALVKDSTGNYHLDVEPTVQGVWKYRWEGLTSNKGAGESSFTVAESVFD